MALDATAFSGEFSNMFAAFAEQQKIFQDKFLEMVDALGKTTGAKKEEYQPQNEKQKSWLFGRPKTKDAPRTVKKEAVKVFIEDVSKKAASKLNQTPEGTERTAEQKVPETKMGLLALLGGLLGAGAVAVIGKVFGAGAGAGVAGGLLSKVGKYIFKPLKLVAKRLPIIGSLFSFWEAYEHFKLGGVDNIMLGLLDVAAGFMYMIPGIGTAIGLGLDIVSYFINERVEEHKVEGGDTSWLGSMYDKVIEYLSETDTIKWMVELGKLFGELWAKPTDLEAWKAFGMHLGGPMVKLMEMLRNFDKKAGAALGVTDEKGESMGLVATLVKLVTTYVVDPLLNMIKQVFEYLGDAIDKAAQFVKDKARDAGAFLSFGYMDTAAEKRAKEEEASVEEQRKLYRLLIQRHGDPGDEQKLIDLHDEIQQDDDRKRKFDKSVKNRIEGGFPYKAEPLEDFAVINGEVVKLPKTAIISGGRVQGFSGDDTVIGFKEGEALVTGINSLIEVGENQLKALKEYLETASQNVIAPTNNSSNTYNFSVETDVSSFRKLVT